MDKLISNFTLCIYILRQHLGQHNERQRQNANRRDENDKRQTRHWHPTERRHVPLHMATQEREHTHHRQTHRRRRGRGQQQHAAAQPVDQQRGHIGAGHLNGGQNDGRDVRIYVGAGVTENGGRIVDERKATAELIDGHEADADQETSSGGRSAYIIHLK